MATVKRSFLITRRAIESVKIFRTQRVYTYIASFSIRPESNQVTPNLGWGFKVPNPPNGWMEMYFSFNVASDSLIQLIFSLQWLLSGTIRNHSDAESFENVVFWL